MDGRGYDRSSPWANAHMHTRTHIRTHRRTHVRSHVCTYVGTMFRPMFKPMFRPMFRNKVTFEKWPPNTKYALGGLGSYRNKVTFYIKGNLKGNLISEHACESACVHAHERACVHAYVRAYMRMCDPFVRPLNAPSRGWARLKIARVSNTNNFVPVFLGCISRCKIISAQVDCTNYHQAKQD